MRILITGAAGFIGSNLARVLQDSHELIGLDDLSTGRRGNLDSVAIDLRIGSVLDHDVLGNAVRGVDAVVHLAALPSVPRSIASPVETHQANASGTLAVLEAIRRERRSGGSDDHAVHPLVIVASSSSVYGANPVLPKTEDLVPMPMSPYAVSKLAAENYALAWQRSYGLETLVLRLFNVYGPRQPADHDYAAVIPRFVASGLRREPLIIDGDGRQTRDFTHVSLVCSVIEDALDHHVSHSTPVNVASGSETTLLDLVGCLEEILGYRLETTHHEPRAGDVRHSWADNDVMRSLFPGITPLGLREGLRSTVEWLCEHHDS